MWAQKPPEALSISALPIKMTRAKSTAASGTQGAPLTFHVAFYFFCVLANSPQPNVRLEQSAEQRGHAEYNAVIHSQRVPAKKMSLGEELCLQRSLCLSQPIDRAGLPDVNISHSGCCICFIGSCEPADSQVR